MLKQLAAIILVSATITTPKYAPRQMGAEIYALQSRMTALGHFNIKLTGMYGTLTENAFKKFQNSNNLGVTGIVTDEELNVLYSIKAQPYLDSNRYIQADPSLSRDNFDVIDQRVTQNFDIELVTVKKTAKFTVTSSRGHLIGKLSNIDTSKLNANLRYPVVATIQGVRYPASIDFSGSEAHLHFFDSKSHLGIPDSEHQFNIKKLLGI